MDFNSELLTSETKKEGMKFITQSVYSILKENKECTYQFICSSLSTQNSETANRRIYDVLNVMRAVNLAGKKNKVYFLIDKTDDIKKKKSEKKKLIDMKETFQYITTRNELLSNTDSERLYLPFMIISTDKKSEIHCDTNEERSFFNFKSNKPLRVIEDLGVLREIREQSKEDARKHSKTLSFDTFII
ncbi:Transcription factor dpl-1 [Glugoides intestinalis]